jgi:hypothetical protein
MMLSVPVLPPALRVGAGRMLTALPFDDVLAGGMRGIPGLEPSGLLAGPLWSVTEAGWSATVLPGEDG